VTDRFADARAVADAVLHEGHILYPYRASALKNQMRWQFGVLVPPLFAEADGSERSSLQVECLVEPDRDDSALYLRMRCLQLQRRVVEAAVPASAPHLGRPAFVATEVLEVAGRRYVPWDEAVEQTVDPAPVVLGPKFVAQRADFVLPDERRVEPVVDRHAGGGHGGPEPEGRIVRLRDRVDGRVDVDVVRCGGDRLTKVTVRVENTTLWTGSGGSDGRDGRDGALCASLIAVHLMLAVDSGRFLSVVDPPAHARDAAAGCHQDGAFPVLVGEDRVVLASPIILPDHPVVAPESPGDLYDATEIDEILALRVLTMTDDERAEARATDQRAAALIERCDQLSPEAWERLHGAVRALAPCDHEPLPWWDPAVDGSADPWTSSVVIAGSEVRKGSAVRLCPSRRSDAQDLFLHGMSATVAGVFEDVDGGVQVAVTVDDDPATDALAWQGRYLFFHPEEVEPLAAPGGAP